MLNGFFAHPDKKDRAGRRNAQFAGDSRFDSTWGKASPMQKQVSRPDYGQQEVQAKQDLHAEILMGCHLNKMNTKRNSVPQKLTSESEEFLKTFRDKYDGGVDNEQVSNLLPKDVLILLFELMKVYAYEYNTAVGLGPFHLELTKPHALVTHAPASAQQSQANLSTSTHTMIMRTDTDVIRFYVLPLEIALSINKCDLPYEPDTLLQMRQQKKTIYWETKAGMPLTMSRVDATCRALFQWLIERTADRVAGEY